MVPPGHPAFSGAQTAGFAFRFHLDVYFLGDVQSVFKLDSRSQTVLSAVA